MPDGDAASGQVLETTPGQPDGEFGHLVGRVLSALVHPVPHHALGDPVDAGGEGPGVVLDVGADEPGQHGDEAPARPPP